MTSLETDRWTQLQEELENKFELIDERRNNLVIKVFWLRLTNEVTMLLHDMETAQSYEFPIPNDKVLDARDHPFYYARRQGVL